MSTTSFRDMVTLANLDTSFLVHCKHCDDLMQEGDRFCPTCGKDQATAVQPASPGPTLGTTSADSGFDNGLGLVRPDSLWRAEALRGAAPEPSVGAVDPPNRWLLGIAMGLAALLVFALVHDSFFADPQRSAADTAASALRGVKGKIDQLQGASRGADPRADEPASPAVVEPAAPAGPAPSVPEAPVSRTPAQAVGETPDKGCNEAMVALALCQRK